MYMAISQEIRVIKDFYILVNSIYQDFDKKLLPANFSTNLFKTTKDVIRKNTPNHITAAKFIKIMQDQMSLSESVKTENENQTQRRSSNKGNIILEF